MLLHVPACYLVGFKSLSSDPNVIRENFKVEYEHVVPTVDLVKLINTYTTPEASNIIQLAKNTGFILHDSGSALPRRGQVRDEITDTDLETQRLCAHKALLQEQLARHQLDLVKGGYQATHLSKQCAELMSRKRAMEARVRATGSTIPCFGFRCA